MKTDKRYWYVLLIPVVAIIAIVVFLIPRNKHHDWDDEEENGQRESSSIERVNDEEINNFEPAPDPAWDGNSPAIRDEVAMGVVISADANAFEKPTHVAFTPVHGQQAQQAMQTVSEQKYHIKPFAVFKLDAGLGAEEAIPGQFTVDFNLEKLGIPEILWPQLNICRIDANGIVQEWNSSVKDGHLSFRSNQNSDWVMGLTGLVTLFTDEGLGIIANVLGKLAFKCVTGKASLLEYYRPQGSHAPENIRDATGRVLCDDYLDCVILLVKDPVVGAFYLGFNPFETELEYIDADNYMTTIQKLRKMRLHIIDEADRKFHIQGSNAVLGSWIDVDAYDLLAKLAFEEKACQEDEAFRVVVKDEALLPPKSVMNVIKMIQMSHIFLQSEENLKRPEKMCDVFLVGNDFQLQDGNYINLFDYEPMLTVRYFGNYIETRKDTTEFRSNRHDRHEHVIIEEDVNYLNQDVTDKLWISITHEVYHHWHACYKKITSMTRNMRLAEATAAICEDDFAAWLKRMRYINYDPFELGDKLFVNRQYQQYMAFALDRLIMPSNLNNVIFTSNWLKLKDKYVEIIKAITRELGRLTINQPVDNTPSQWYDPLLNVLNTQWNIIKSTYETDANNLHVTKELFGDLIGCFGMFWKGPNVDAGYMLSSFITYLRMNVHPNVTLHDILCSENRNSMTNFAGMLRDAFGIASDSLFYIHYENFVKENMEVIADQEYKYSLDRDAKTYYTDQVMQKIVFSSDSYVERLHPWTHPGAFACKTVRFFNEGGTKFNLCLIPSPRMADDIQKKGVKVSILKNDNTFPSNPYYLEVDSNANSSPRDAVFLFTPAVREATLGTDCFFTAVALPKPYGSPEANMNGNCVEACYKFNFSYGFKDLMEKSTTGYDGVIGIVYTVKNMKTGNQTEILHHYTDIYQRFTPITIAIPDLTPGQEMTLSVSCKLFYQPDVNDPAIYYSPNSDAVEITGIAEDVTEPEPEPVEADSDILYDRDIRMTIVGEISISDYDEMVREAGETGAHLDSISDTGHITFYKDGRFHFTFPAINWSMSVTGMRMQVRQSVIDIKGKVNMKAIGHEKVDLEKLDKESLECATVSYYIKGDADPLDDFEGAQGEKILRMEVDKDRITSGVVGRLVISGIATDNESLENFRLSIPCHITGTKHEKEGNEPTETEQVDKDGTLTISSFPNR